LPKFVNALQHCEAPVLVDFGPVIGTNVAFFGEQLGCKLFIEDLATQIDVHNRQGTRDQLPQALAKRFPHPDASVDGVLCWDIFDFLEKAAALPLAREIVRVLRPGGAVLGFFCTSAVERAPFTKFEIVADSWSLRHRHHEGTGGTKFALQNRDIIKMFDGLSVSESFLLKSNTREILLRKRA
jgi:SAM-dependent methyltransferase